jgi:hypothetical protein
MPLCGSEGCQAIVFGSTEYFRGFCDPVSLLAQPCFSNRTQQLLQYTLCKIGLFPKMNVKGSENFAQ